jgi:hypothetical protein
MHRRQGNSRTMVLVILVAAVAAAAVVLSKPFRTRFPTTPPQTTEWSPAHIQQDPVGYLTWGHAECAKTEESLSASRLSLRNQRNAADRALASYTAEQSAYQQLLEQAKTLYRLTATSSNWPVSLRGIPMDEYALKAKVVECHDKLASLAESIATHQQARQILDRRVEEVDRQLEAVSRMKSKLAADLDVARLRQSVDGITALSHQLQSIVSTSEALVAPRQDDMRLEDLAATPADRHVNETFDTIMRP